MSEFIIRSNPKKLTWAHKVVAVLLVCAIIAILVIGYNLITNIGSTDYRTLVNAVVLLGLCAGVLYRDLIGTEVASYSTTRLIEFHTQFISLNGAYEFTNLERVIKRSPECIVLIAKPDHSFKIRGSRTISELNELTLRGHADDLNRFCDVLKQAGHPAVDDGIGDDPPRQLAAMMFIAALALGLTFWGLFAIVAHMQHR